MEETTPATEVEQALPSTTPRREPLNSKALEVEVASEEEEAMALTVRPSMRP